VTRLDATVGGVLVGQGVFSVPLPGDRGGPAPASDDPVGPDATPGCRKTITVQYHRRPMANDPLVTYLDSIDKRLLDYLDEDDELAVVTTRRLRSHISELLAGTMTTAELTAAWPDWFDLVSAFVVIYGSLELEDLEVDSFVGTS
jgi:hypothetical protein